MIKTVLPLLILANFDSGVVILKDSDEGPLLAELGQDLSLFCNYQVMSGSLYSIKWYRDDKEFFRYIPRESPPYTIFLVSGVSVDDRSKPTHIILKNISLQTSGSFKCEVSGGPPRFQTDESVIDLQVVDLPHVGPKISGVQSKYNVGDMLTADCMLPVSHPPADLTWYINTDTADQAYISDQFIVTRHSNMSTNSSVLYRTSTPYIAVSLNFTIQEKHLRLEDNVMSLKCTAEVMDLYWRTSEVSVTVALAPRNWYSPHVPVFSSSPLKSSSLRILSILVTLTFLLM